MVLHLNMVRLKVDIGWMYSMSILYHYNLSWWVCKSVYPCSSEDDSSIYCHQRILKLKIPIGYLVSDLLGRVFRIGYVGIRVSIQQVLITGYSWWIDCVDDGSPSSSNVHQPGNRWPESMSQQANQAIFHRRQLAASLSARHDSGEDEHDVEQVEAGEIIPENHF